MSELLLGYLLLLLHVVTATVWYGLAMRVGHHARLVSSLERSAASELARQTRRAVALLGVDLLVTFILTLPTVLFRPVADRAALVFWGAVGLLALLLLLHYGFLSPLWRRMQRAVTIGEPSQVATLLKSRKRLLGLLGVSRVLWLVVLVLIAWSAVVEW